MKKNIFKQVKFKYIIISLILLAIISGLFILREVVTQRQIDQCYNEARARYEEALENVKDIPGEKTNNSRISPWPVEDVETKMKLREQLQKDEDRCIKRYK